MDGSRPRLLIDENVAGLARWLRFLGFDAEVAAGVPDTIVAARARQENRILISRDRVLLNEFPEDRVVWISQDDQFEQLKSVLRRLGPTPASDWFRLCSVCNVQLLDADIDKLAANQNLPSFITDSKDSEIRRAWICPSCGRVYWKGSHYDRTVALLRKIVAKVEAERGAMWDL